MSQGVGASAPERRGSASSSLLRRDLLLRMTHLSGPPQGSRLGHERGLNGAGWPILQAADVRTRERRLASCALAAR